MNLPLRSTALAAVATLALLGCKQNAPATPGVSVGACENPDTVIATYSGGKKVTLKDVDALVGGQLKQLEKQKLQLRKQAIDQVAVEAYAEEQAKVQGIPKDEWIRNLVQSFSTPPSPEEVAAFFQANQERMPPGATLETMRPQLEQHLAQRKQGEAVNKMITSVREKTSLQILLEEPRTQVEATGPTTGPSDAKVTIVEFSDFECPFCSRAEGVLDQVMTAHAGKVRLVFRHLPLPMHPNAQKAAEASLCAHDQAKFWEYKKALFQNQDKLGVEGLKQHAKDVGLDAAKFDACLDGSAMKAKVEADSKAATVAAVQGTPTFFVNGVQVDPVFEEFDRVIKQELASAK